MKSTLKTYWFNYVEFLQIIQLLVHFTGTSACQEFAVTHMSDIHIILSNITCWMLSVQLCTQSRQAHFSQSQPRRVSPFPSSANKLSCFVFSPRTFLIALPMLLAPRGLFQIVCVMFYPRWLRKVLMLLVFAFAYCSDCANWTRKGCGCSEFFGCLAINDSCLYIRS